MEDLRIEIDIKMLNEEYCSLEIKPSRKIETDELLTWLEWVWLTAQNPPPRLRVVK